MVDSDGWKLGGASPFLTERARVRAPEILAYVGIAGAAMLVSPAGVVVLVSGDATEVDAGRIARIAAARRDGEAVWSFRVGSTCVHTASVCHGWTLCVLSTAGVPPSLVSDRLRRASYVLALALMDGVEPVGGVGGGNSGAPAEVSIAGRGNAARS